MEALAKKPNGHRARISSRLGCARTRDLLFGPTRFLAFLYAKASIPESPNTSNRLTETSADQASSLYSSVFWCALGP